MDSSPKKRKKRDPKPESGAAEPEGRPDDLAERKAEAESDSAAETASAGAAAEPDARSKGRDDEDDEDEDEESPPAAPSEPEQTLWDVVRDTYFTFDRRTLGLSRIFLGFFLVMDLFRRTEAWHQMFSREGVLPNHVNMFRPQGGSAFSIVNAFSTRPELTVLWCVVLITFLCLLFGYKTRVAQVLSLVFVTGMNGRVLLIENGGYVVHNLLLLWTAFLPMGGRFSVDAMIASMRRTRERTDAELNDRSTEEPRPAPEESARWRLVARAGAITFGAAAIIAGSLAYIYEGQALYLTTMASIVLALVSAFALAEKSKHPHAHNTVLGLVLLLQLSAIYYFNVIHKTGPAWKNGTAVHYVLHVDRMVTPLVAHVRDYIPGFAIIFMTKAALAMEAAMAVTLLSPLGRVWARRLSVVMINLLHIGFGVVFVLGPFAWACCIFSTLLFGREDWEITTRTMRRAYRARVVVYDRGSPAALLLCRLLKRMDNFALLTFRAEDGVRTGFRVEDHTRGDEAAPVTSTRALALAEIVAALPLGPAIAWALRLPGPRHVADALLGRCEGGRLSRFFGMQPALPIPGGTEPAPLRRAGRRALFVLREIGILVMFTGAVHQAMVELWVVKNRIKIPHPEPIRLLSHKMRFLQGWFMFSPNPVMDDGTIVVDAITVDGRHIDPFTEKEPNFDLTHAKSLRHNQIWCDYFNRIQLPGNTSYREQMKEYMYRLPERTGNPDDAIVSGDVYWVKDMNPRWGETTPWKYERAKLFSFANRAIIPNTKAASVAPARPVAAPAAEPAQEAFPRTETEPPPKTEPQEAFPRN